MNIFIFISLLLITIVFYMLEISFGSFSRISLAGFLEDQDNNGTKRFDYVEKYRVIQNALRGFAFLLQLGLFICSYLLLETVITKPVERLAILIISFLLLFNLLLYTISFSYKEGILKRLIFLTPVAWFFFYPVNAVSFGFIKEKPEEKEAEDDDPSDKELEVFFEEGTKEGVLEKEDQEMIESVIEFGDTRVKEIITPRVDMTYVDISVSLDDLVEIINKSKRSRYPVISERIDNIEGVILAKDVFDYWNHNASDFSVSKILRKGFFVPESMRVFELLKELQKSKQKFAIVVDEFGGISGMVTMEDIIEEIVGEIHDEYDVDTEQIVEEKDCLIVKGDTDAFELGERLNVDLEEDEDYQTVAGLISYKLGKIPDKSDKVVIENYTLEVLEIDKNRVKKVKITPTGIPGDPDKSNDREL